MRTVPGGGSSHTAERGLAEPPGGGKWGHPAKSIPEEPTPKCPIPQQRAAVLSFNFSGGSGVRAELHQEETRPNDSREGGVLQSITKGQ